MRVRTFGQRLERRRCQIALTAAGRRLDHLGQRERAEPEVAVGDGLPRRVQRGRIVGQAVVEYGLCPPDAEAHPLARRELLRQIWLDPFAPKPGVAAAREASGIGGGAPATRSLGCRWGSTTSFHNRTIPGTDCGADVVVGSRRHSLFSSCRNSLWFFL